MMNSPLRLVLLEDVLGANKGRWTRLPRPAACVPTPHHELFNDQETTVKAGVIAFLKEQPGAGECVAADGISARSSALFDCAGETSKPVEFIVTEVMNQRRASRESGGKFVIPVPDFRVV